MIQFSKIHLVDCPQVWLEISNIRKKPSPTSNRSFSLIKVNEFKIKKWFSLSISIFNKLLIVEKIINLKFSKLHPRSIGRSYVHKMSAFYESKQRDNTINDENLFYHKIIDVLWVNNVQKGPHWNAVRT